MKTKEFLTMTAVAASTATLTVVTFLAGGLVADNEPSQLADSISKPKLVMHGVELSAALAGDLRAMAGAEPIFVLDALNTTGESTDVAVRLMLYATAPSSPMSRTLPMPTLLWQEERQMTMKEKEHKTLQFSAPVSLPPNSVITLSLTEVNPAGEDSSPLGNDVVQLSKFTPAFIPSGVTVLTFSTTQPQASSAIAAISRTE